LTIWSKRSDPVTRPVSSATFIKTFAAAFTALVVGATAQANAAVITYDLIDTPFPGLETGGFYQYTGGHPNFDTLSFEQNGADAKLVYNDDLGTVRLLGTGYNLTTDELSNFDLFYDDVTQSGDSLSLNNMGFVGSVDGSVVSGKGFDIILGDTLRGDGWLTNTVAGGHFGDFHFAGVRIDNGDCVGGTLANGGSGGCGGGSVPAPAPLGLLVAAGLFGILRRKRAIIG